MVKSHPINMKIFTLIALIIVGLVLPEGIWALDADVRTNGIASIRYERDRNFRLINPAMKFTDESIFSLYMWPSLSADIGDYTSLTFSLFSGEVSRRTLDPDAQSKYGFQYVGNYAADTYFIREVYIDVTNLDWLDVTAGRQRVVAGSSFILDAYQPSLVVDISPMSAPVNVSASLVKVEPYKLFDPDRKSIVGEAEASYFFDPFESEGVTVFLTALFDNDNFLAGLLNTMTAYEVDDLIQWLKQQPEYLNDFLTALAKRFYRTYGHLPTAQEMDEIVSEILSASFVRSSSGTILWPGIRAQKSFGDVTLKGEIIWEFGALNVAVHDPVRIYEPKQTTSIDLMTSGFLCDFNAIYQPVETFSLKGFFLYQQGESDRILKILNNRSFSSFLAVSPFITYTNLFFNGGINENFSAGSLSAAGRNGSGVIMPGLTFDWSVTDSLDLTGTLAFIASDDPRGYLGTENDLGLSYDLIENLSLVFEADRFFPAWKGREPIWRAAAGVDITW